MFCGNYRKEKSCEDMKYENQRLEAENQRYREEQEERANQRERDRRDREEQRREEMSHASSWPEAFRKGLYLYRKEAEEERRDNARYKDETDWTPTNYFQELPAKIEKAEQIYLEEMRIVEVEIKALQQRVLHHIADLVEIECGYPELAQALREDETDWLVNW